MKLANARLCVNAAIRAVAARRSGLSAQKAAAARRLVFAHAADDAEDGDGDEDGDASDDEQDAGDDVDDSVDDDDDDDDGDDGDAHAAGAVDADVEAAAGDLRALLRRHWQACPAAGRVKLSKMPLAARWLALKEMLSTPGAARPKFRRRIAPHANANAHSLRLDVQSLRQAAGISKSVADGDVFRSVLSDYDAVLSRLSRSSRNAMVLESLIVSGYDAMAVVHCQSRAPAIRKRALIDETKRLCAALERLSQPGTGYSAWLERCIEDNLRSLYPHRSYMSLWLLAFWHDVRRAGAGWRGKIEELLNDIELDDASAAAAAAAAAADDDDDDDDDAAGAVAAKAKAKKDDKKKEKKLASASHAHFGLGKKLFDRMVGRGGISPCRLRCGVAFPQRLLVEGLVRVRTVGELRELVERIFVVGDTGFAALVTLILARAAPLESGERWRALLARDDSDMLSEADLLALLDDLKFDTMERKVRACRRFKVDAFVSDAARAAAALLSRSSLTTGGLSAADPAALRSHQVEFVGAFEALYASSMANVLRGAAQAKWAAKQKRRAADVAAVVRAVAEFRLLLWLQSWRGSAPPTDEDIKREVGRIFRPATKFDDGVLVLIGKVTFGSSRRGFAPTPAKDFVKALARTFTVIELSEFNTSKLDWRCGTRMVLASTTSFRFWSNPFRPEERQNKDVSSRASLCCASVCCC
jgi:hypothetical protein